MRTVIGVIKKKDMLAVFLPNVQLLINSTRAKRAIFFSITASYLKNKEHLF